MTLKVAHVITGLEVGGAEKALLSIATASRQFDVKPVVVCLTERGPVSELLEAEKVSVHHIGMRSVLQFPMGVTRLSKVLQDLRPDLIQGWMYHGNLAATMASSGIDVPVAWNVRQSLHRVDLFKKSTRLMIKANAALSRRANSIIYNSQVARQQHEEIGFWPACGTCIPNGVDLQCFRPDLADRNRVRQELSIAADETVVIAVGRVHPIKGHEVLMRAVELVVRADPEVRFVVVGKGADWSLEPFSAFGSKASIRERTLLLDEGHNVAELLAAADVFVSTSHTEGFPNAVAEAMAAQLPCVVTDVGDSRMLLADFGRVVVPGDADAVAEALLGMTLGTPESRHKIGAGARSRVTREFSLAKIAEEYLDHHYGMISAFNRSQSA